MARRNKIEKIKGKKAHHRQRSQPGRRAAQPVMDVEPDRIAAAIYHRDGVATAKEIEKDLEWPRSTRRDLHLLLDSLVKQRVLVDLGDKSYGLNAKDFFQGTLVVNPKGFGFVTPTAVDRKKDEKDIFVPARFLGTAAHGDTVLLQQVGAARGRTEGRVVAVLKRGLDRLVGIFLDGVVTPDDSRLLLTVKIDVAEGLVPSNGDAVMVALDEFRAESRVATGRITEILGDPGSAKVQMEMVIRNFELPLEFPDEVLAQVADISATVEVEEGREDLRDIFHVTIDDETARDFDDAVIVEKGTKGFRLYVSIADVSHYVEKDSPLDKEAYQRGTSVYFPTGVLPMLPERLSNGLCSLNPNEDRYAFTAILDFDDTGKRVQSRFCRSVIKSRFRLTYNRVWEIIQGNLDQEGDRELQGPVAAMAQLGTLLTKRRMGRGAIGFELPEVGIVVGEDERVEALMKRERNQAHKIIEEFMLAANEAVAETMAREEVEILYRIHEVPDPVKVEEFAEFAHSFLAPLPKATNSPQWFNAVLAKAVGTPKEYMVNNLLLRVMKQACYSPENVGHFGLAASYYCHFTSPIRRYPDLQVHRALAGWLTGTRPSAKAKAKLLEAGEFLSKRERVAVDAERQMVNRLKVQYMANHVGSVFPGIISGVTDWGLFIELDDLMVSGAITLSDLKDDYYVLEEKMHRLVGKRSGKRYQLGDLVLVRVASVDLLAYRINFVLEEDLSAPV
ncbi:MAG: ribonuclease R [Desulfurivibrionaceae bacterium]|nr:ribonuclease R [Desulfurivibrionaceae bacterium]